MRSCRVIATDERGRAAQHRVVSTGAVHRAEGEQSICQTWGDLGRSWAPPGQSFLLLLRSLGGGILGHSEISLCGGKVSLWHTRGREGRQ